MAARWVLLVVAALSSLATAQTTLPVAPEVKAATQLLGLGRQRLALVVGLSRVGDVDLPAVRRDAAAVAASLRHNGYLVMARPDLGADDLRRAVAEFRQRLAPDGAGLIYIAGAGARLDGRSWLITRSLPPGEGNPDAAALKAASMPLDELVLALQITPASLRLLVVDAATPLPRLPAAWHGLVAPTLPEGVMALLSAQPGQVLPRWQPPPLPSPAPEDPRATTGSPFGTAFVHALLASGHTGPQVLLETRRLTLDATGRAVDPWLGGRTDERDELGAPTIPIAQWPEAAAKRAMAAVGGQALEALRRNARPTQAPAPEVAPPTPGTPPVAAGPAVAAGTALTQAAAGAIQAGVTAAAQAEAAKVAAAQTVATQAVGAAIGVVAATARALGTADDAPTPAATRSGQSNLEHENAGKRDAQDGGPPAATLAGRQPPSPLAEPPPPAATTTPAPPPPAAAAPGPPSPAPPAAPAVPAALPLNPYGYAPGDSFTYRRIDEWKGESVGLVMQVIETLQTAGDLAGREGDDTVAFDAQGRVRSRHGPAGSATFTPAEAFWWARPKVGESRDIGFDEVFENRDGRGERRWEGEVEVGRPTRITTSAGTFDVLPMEGEGWVREWRMPQRTRRDVQWERTVWYSPELGHPVAVDILERDAANRLLRKERLELVHVHTSRSVPR